MSDANNPYAGLQLGQAGTPVSPPNQTVSWAAPTMRPPAASVPAPAPASEGTPLVSDGELSGWKVFGGAAPLASIGPNDLVTIGGMKTAAHVAEQLGYVERRPEGGYRPTTAGQAEADTRDADRQRLENSKRAEAGAVEADLALPETDARAFETVSQAIPFGLRAQALDELSLPDGGQLSPRTLAEASRLLGVSPGQAHNIVRQLTAALSDQVGRMMARAGIEDAGEFHAWLQATGKASEFRAAQLGHLASGDLSGYRRLTDAYTRKQGHADNERAFKTATYDANLSVREVNGRMIYKHPSGAEMSVEQARQFGFLHVK